MKKFLIAALATATLVFAGCTTVMPVCATSNDMGSRVGTSHGGCILGLFCYGNNSIEHAAKKGGITKITTVDMKTTRIVGGLIWTGWATIVTGE